MSGPTATRSTRRRSRSQLHQPTTITVHKQLQEMPQMSAKPVESLFIDATWAPGSAAATRAVYCPADGSEVGVVSEATTEDTERAIAAARASFDSGVWADRPAIERGDFHLDVANALQERKEEFARAEALDTGKRFVEAQGDMDDIISCFR